MTTPLLRIAFLHLAPVPGAVAQNRHLITGAITKAACAGAGWIITPELAVSGYTFADTIGTGWIEPQPDHWMRRICSLAARLHVTLFLSHPEQDSRAQQFHNTLFAIGPDGRIAGRHRKINALRVGSEAWSTPGTEATAFRLAPFGPIGLLICADAYTPGIAKSLKAQGATVLVSSAAWAPGLHGPNGEWERCTVDTGLPLFVCNRTGQDRTLDFRSAESVVVQGGKRLFSLSCEQSAIFLVDWNLDTGTPAGTAQRMLL